MSHSAMEVQQLPALKDEVPFSGSPDPVQFQPPWLAETNRKRSVRRILVATDFSAASSRALDLALSLAHQCDASITLLHVIDISAQTVAGKSMPAAQLMKCLWEAAFENMGRLASSLSGQLNAQTGVEEGLPCELIAERSRSFDLLVIGQAQAKPCWNWFSHQTVERVLQNAACPVIVATQQQSAAFPVLGHPDLRAA